MADVRPEIPSRSSVAAPETAERKALTFEVKHGVVAAKEAGQPSESPEKPGHDLSVLGRAQSKTPAELGYPLEICESPSTGAIQNDGKALS